MNVLPPTLLREGTRVADPICQWGYSCAHPCYVERLLTESEANLCWASTSLVLLAPFVWLMSECDALPSFQ